MGWKMRKDKLQSDQPDGEATQDEEFQDQEQEPQIEADASAMARLAQLSADSDGGSAFVLDLDKEVFRTTTKPTSLDPSEFAWFNDAQSAPAKPAPEPPRPSTNGPSTNGGGYAADPGFNPATFTPAPPPAYNRSDYQQSDYPPPSFDPAPPFAEPQRPAFDPAPPFAEPQRPAFDPAPQFAEPQRPAFDLGTPPQPVAQVQSPPSAVAAPPPFAQEEDVQWNGPRQQPMQASAPAAPAWAEPEPATPPAWAEPEPTPQPSWAQEPAQQAAPPPAFADPSPSAFAPPPVQNGRQSITPPPPSTSTPAWAQDPAPFAPEVDNGPFGAPPAPQAPQAPPQAAYTPPPAQPAAQPAPPPAAQYEASSTHSPYASQPTAPPPSTPAPSPYASQPPRPTGDGQNINSFSRDSVAAGLVAGEGDFAIPKVAPFIVSGGSQPEEVVLTTGDHYLIIRIRNLSSSYKLTKDVTTIGRPDSITKNYPDVEIDLDDGVSRKHAEIRKKNGDYYVVDLGSTNGTLLNGDIMDVNVELKLAHGDRIRVGEKTEIVFE